MLWVVYETVEGVRVAEATDATPRWLFSSTTPAFEKVMHGRSTQCAVIGQGCRGYLSVQYFFFECVDSMMAVSRLPVTRQEYMAMLSDELNDTSAAVV